MRRSDLYRGLVVEIDARIAGDKNAQVRKAVIIDADARNVSQFAPYGDVAVAVEWQSWRQDVPVIRPALIRPQQITRRWAERELVEAHKAAIAAERAAAEQARREEHEATCARLWHASGYAALQSSPLTSQVGVLQGNYDRQWHYGDQSYEPQIDVVADTAIHSIFAAVAEGYGYQDLADFIASNVLSSSGSTVTLLQAIRRTVEPTGWTRGLNVVGDKLVSEFLAVLESLDLESDYPALFAEVVTA